MWQILFFGSLVVCALAQTTPKPQTDEEICASRNDSCANCVSYVKCLYCGTRTGNKCIVYPTGQIIPHADYCELSAARWGVCWVNYEALLISVGVITGVLLISLGVCCYCCCCRSKRSRNSLSREDVKWERDKEDRKNRGEERRAERGKKLDEIRRKYGLVKDEQPYERMSENA